MNARQKAKHYKKLLDFLIYRQHEDLKRIRFEREKVQIEKIEVSSITDDRVIFFKIPPEVESARVATQLGNLLFSNHLVNVSEEKAGADTLQKKIYSVEIVRRKAND